MNVKVIDAIMGTGKTSASINFINKSDDDVKFLYITPYLTEVKRIISSCPHKNFKQPESYGNKLNGIKHLFEKGCNIVSTHSLFSMFDEEVIDLAYANNYTLIMDEVADVIEPYEITKNDLETILEKYAAVDKHGVLKWHAKDYDGKFQNEKRLCDIKCLAVYGDTAILWLFPITTFRAFRDIYILTYMFNAQTQKYYYDYYGVDYTYLFIKGNDINTYEFTTDNVIYNVPDYSKLIHICDVQKLNRIGDMSSALSKTWFERNKNNQLIKQLKNSTSNYFKNYTKTKSNENLWTTFKAYKSLVAGKGYAKGFLSSNVRATNEYRNRVAVAYLINKYFNPCIKNFFTLHNIEVEEDAFALSEMLQFIWRAAIRDNKEIWLYIPSSRMRNLLVDWIKDVSGKDSH